MAIFNTDLHHLLCYVLIHSIANAVALETIHVCLKGDVYNDTLKLTCTVSSLTLEVVIINPDGETVGSCTAPIRMDGDGPFGTCTTERLSQNLDTNITRLILDKAYQTSFYGTWTCTHGTNRGSDSFTVKELNVKQLNEKKNCIIQIVGTCIVTFLSTFTLGLCAAAYRYSWYKKFRVQLRESQKGRSTRSTSPENEPLTAEDEEFYRLSLCNTCGNLTAFSYCNDCKKFFCEACFELHSSTEHTILQIEHIPVSAHAAKCMMCKKKNSHRVCLICQELFCDSCTCTHKHKSNMIKPLVIKLHDIMRQRCSECRISVGSEKVVWTNNISIPQDQLPTRICGIAFLSVDHIALADFSNKKVKVFSGDKFKFAIELSKEPRCMVGMYDTAIAITFPYEKAIEIYKIDTDKQRKTAEIIDLHEIGKPYNIAYNQERFAVEIGAGIDGFVVILNMNGETLNKITSAVNYAFFTGHTIRLALDTLNERVIISAMSKKAVTCLDFDGNEKWSITVPSPRGAYFVNGIPNENSRTIFLASKRGNTIYQINSSNGTSNVLMASKDIMNPRSIAYNYENHLFCIQVLGDDEEDELAIYKYNAL